MNKRISRSDAKTICTVRSCSEPALWRVVSTGHPNGDINACYCSAHVRVPYWEDSPASYSVTVTGPLDL